jgi:hypothetical protein
MLSSRVAVGCAVGIPAATFGETSSADGEEVRQSGDVEDLADGLLQALEDENVVAVLFAQPFQGPDQDAESRRIDEGDVAEVEDQPGRFPIGELVQLAAKLG